MREPGARNIVEGAVAAVVVTALIFAARAIAPPAAPAPRLEWR